MIELRASQTAWPGIFLDEEPLVGLATGCAGERLAWPDHHEVRRLALLLRQALPVLVGQVRGDPVRAVGAFEVGGPALAELE